MKGSTSWLKGKKGVTSNPLKGKKMPEEWKAKFRKPKSVIQPFSVEHRRKISENMKKRVGVLNPRFGKPLSEESKAKISASNLGKHIGFKHTEETKRKISKSSAGSNSHNWIADRSKLAKLTNGNEYRNSPAYKEWSRSVKNRDGWKCKISNGDCSGKVVAHHILSWRDYVELRYEVNNGITLCRKHHPLKRDEENKLSPYFQKLVLEAN